SSVYVVKSKVRGSAIILQGNESSVSRRTQSSLPGDRRAFVRSRRNIFLGDLKHFSYWKWDPFSTGGGSAGYTRPQAVVFQCQCMHGVELFHGHEFQRGVSDEGNEPGTT